VTVQVLNWNGQALLPACLDALAKQDLDPALWQTWVVDNASADDSLDLLARDYPDVHVVRNSRNLGFAGGNNVGLRAVTTPYVVLLNNDAYPEPDWLSHLLGSIHGEGNTSNEPARDRRVAAVTSKVLFQDRYLLLTFETPPHTTAVDPRELGAMLLRVEVDGNDVTEDILWDSGAYGPEEPPGDARFRWSRPTGSLLVPVVGTTRSAAEVTVQVTARADRDKPLTWNWDAPEDGTTGSGATVHLTTTPTTHEFHIPAGTTLVDVVNNVGSILLNGGYGADRGYQEIDTGQYDQDEEVFLLCGAAVCLRTDALADAGVFDDDFFLYYEDTDLSWRLQLAGWDIRYTPDALVRHEHSASSGEWSPLFTFHVERNRLLMLVKDAPAGLAWRQILRFHLTTASMVRWSLLQALRHRRRPAVRPLLLRLRVSASLLRLLPKMLVRRRQIARTRQRTSADLLARWMRSER
jgi:hypothetical protein